VSFAGTHRNQRQRHKAHQLHALRLALRHLRHGGDRGAARGGPHRAGEDGGDAEHGAQPPRQGCEGGGARSGLRAAAAAPARERRLAVGRGGDTRAGAHGK
jgi:hypothetical protein